MQYVNFGSAGVKVSRIALGLGFRGQTSADEAQRLIEHAIDSGINLIDCANSYTLGAGSMPDAPRSEEVLSRVLKTRRDEVVITTKVAGGIGPGPNDQGLSRYHIMREVERSLRRLGTDHIDVYLLHHFDPETPLEETLRALDDLVAQGKVLYVGCCNFAAWQVVQALWTQDRTNADSFICVQNQYSLLYRTLKDEMFGLVRDRGLGVMAFGPLAIGLLSGSYTAGAAPPPASVWAAMERDAFEAATSGYAAVVLDTVRAIARERGKTMPQVALNWVLSHPEITVAISGSDTIEQLDDNLGAVGWELSEVEVARLTEVSSGGHVDLMGV